jgi:protein-serine/threonine kinase
MESYLQKVLRFKVPSETSQITTKPSLDEEETKYSLKTESVNFNDSVLNDSHDSLTDSMSEGPESNFIQKVPVLSCVPARHSSLQQTLDFLKAVKSDSGEVAKFLLEKNSNGDPVIDINCVDSEGDSALHIAAGLNLLKTCQMILDYSEPQINIRDKNFQTPLHVACFKGHLKVAQLLARSGGDINAIDMNGNTPLHHACLQGHGPVVAWLLTRSPGLCIKNNSGKTAEEVSDEIILALFHKYLKNTIALPGPSISQGLKNEAKRVRINEKRENRVNWEMFNGICQIGKGSFGEVYLVSKVGSEKLFAMKVLKKEKIMAHNLIRYALTERNVLTYIRHPFIVSLKFAFQSSEKLFLVLDYCPGGDLSSRLLIEKRFTEHQAKIYICEILLALEELHKRDIIFRDLKPDNIVLDKEGHAMLTDFGLSKEGVSDQTGAKSFCGSVAYLAPEMIKRSGHGKAVDWYLLGVVLYEMLVGVPPYFSSNKDELMNNIQRGKLKMPTSLSVEARELIKDLLIRDPTKRLGAFRDAEEIKQHVFFKGVDWEAVFRRELKPPAAIISQTPASRIPPDRLFGDLTCSEASRVKSWTFVDEDNL